MSITVPLEGFGGGGGAALNFDVKAYASETALKAATPKENTIGIVTTTAINGWVFSAEAPTSYASGMVWIKVGDSSDVAFNALKKNDLQVYPIAAYQRSGSSWVQQTAYSYQGGAWKQLNELPTEYQKVEYLQSSRTQYIDTGLTAKAGSVGIKVKLAYAQAIEQTCAYGFFNTSPPYNYFGLQIANGRFTELYGTGGAGADLGAATTGIIEICHNYKNDKVISLNGTTVLSNSADSTENALNIFLFASNFNGAFDSARAGHIKIYACEMTDGATVVRKFVPCYRKSDSVAGLYDTVSKKFYTNNGSGVFTLGGAVA